MSVTDTDRFHSKEHPHWSFSVTWRAGRWDNMDTAPSVGPNIVHIRGRNAQGKVLEPMHYACGDGDGLMPPFIGWFVPYGEGHKGYYEVTPIEWQPLTAQQHE